MNKKELARHLDLANHHQTATLGEIGQLCQDVLTYGLNSAFVNPCYVAQTKELLQGRAKVGTVVAFPLGQETLFIKLAAAQKAIEDGADELDVSLNVANFKSGEWLAARKEMEAIVHLAKSLKSDGVVKLIIETGCLTEEEIKKASELVLASGADFVKTCSGFGPRGATLDDVRLIRGVVGEQIKIKVAGGVETLNQAMAFLEEGVARIGTSHAVEIVSEWDSHETD